MGHYVRKETPGLKRTSADGALMHRGHVLLSGVSTGAVAADDNLSLWIQRAYRQNNLLTIKMVQFPYKMSFLKVTTFTIKKDTVLLFT